MCCLPFSPFPNPTSWLRQAFDKCVSFSLSQLFAHFSVQFLLGINTVHPSCLLTLLM